MLQFLKGFKISDLLDQDLATLVKLAPLAPEKIKPWLNWLAPIVDSFEAPMTLREALSRDDVFEKLINQLTSQPIPSSISQDESKWKGVRTVALCPHCGNAHEVEISFNSDN